jgi:hypothetical protein
MDTSDFGFWLMLAFFGIAIGGLATGISWACGRDKTPANPDRAVKSLKKRPKASGK